MKDKAIKQAARADYATNFRKMRERDGHTQLSLAYRMDTHQAVVFRIENNKKKVDMDVINDYAEVNEKTPEEVFRELNGGVTVHSAIETNNGNGVNVQQANVEQLTSLYQQIIDGNQRLLEEKQRVIEEKEKYIRLLERREEER